MPEPPIFSKRQPRSVGKTRRRERSVQSYAELHCRTNFSFLEGASHADESVVRAAELGYAALAITDRNSLAGVVRAHAAAKESGFKLLIGAEMTPRDALPVVLLATDRAAYGRLSRLITTGRRQAVKGECEIDLQDIAQHSAGLIAAIVPPPRDALCEEAAVHCYRDIFAERCYLLAELHYGVDDNRRLDQLLHLSQQTRVPLVAAGDVHYHAPQRMMLQHVLTAIRRGITVAELGEACLPNAQRHLRSREEIDRVFARVPDAVRRTIEIADRCSFSLDELRYEYPRELAPPGETPMQYLRRLAWDGAERRYHGDVPDKIRQQLAHELAIIEELCYEAFFLTVHDVVQFARSRRPPILCQGRGSAANSSVCYCLGVTAVDPMQTDLLFERFMSRERNEAPDIDVDFEHERREEVLQYIYQKYGRERAGLAATVITYRPRSAIRDVGKALGLSLDRVDTLAKNVDFRGEGELLADRCRQCGIDPEAGVGRQLIELVNELLGFPRHLSQHVGGMVMTECALCELVPIENAAMPDRTVIQWDKDDLDELGILKVDCLALGMLTAIHKCFDLIESQQHEARSRELSLDGIPFDDPQVYEMISQADTVGVFQIESRAQMSMLPRLRPERFYDLVIEVAIVRPGPIQGNMVHPYLRRRNGEEDVTYPNDEIEQVLHRTLGVPLFQEQAMQLAVVAAGFTPGEADQLRRAMGGWRRPGLIDRFRQKLIRGMLSRGYSEEFSERLFEQIRGFGEYGFPESHAASFARLAYVSAWLKHYHPAAFTAALINSQPMGFYAPAQLIRDARDHGVKVLPVDVNHSNWDCTLEGGGEGIGDWGLGIREAPEHRSPINPQSPALRLGLRLVHGLAQADAEAIVRERGDSLSCQSPIPNPQSLPPFRSITEFAERTKISRAAIERLAEANAFASLQLDRRSALWQALDQPCRRREELPLFAGLKPQDSPTPALPKLSEQEEVFADYQSTSLTLRQHPIAFHREQLAELGVTPAEQLADYPHNRAVKVAGLVLMRQRPSTAKGLTFVTLEDETGIANLVVHLPVWKRYDQVARKSAALVAHGRLERKHDVIHIVVRRLEDLTARLGSLRHKSRDFR